MTYDQATYIGEKRQRDGNPVFCARFWLMNATRVIVPSVLTLAFVLAAAGSMAQTPQGSAIPEPQIGQDGKDVVWVPTPPPLVEKMLDMAGVTAQDYVIDLGSGDGRIVMAAARRGARALGIEYDADLVELSKRTAASEGLSGRAAFAQADLFESDFSQATVVTMFLLSEIMVKVRGKILDLKPGTRVVSNFFTMNEWTTDETAKLSGCTTWCTAHLWIVPAKVAGTWRLPQGELTLTQEFQMLSGTLTSSGSRLPVTGRLRGDQITFSVAGAEYVGRANGNSLEGTVTSGSSRSNWSAIRAR